MKTFFKYWLLVLLWAGFIFGASSLPARDIPSLFFAQDILFHIFEYTLLALLLARALNNSQFLKPLSKTRRFFLVIIICLIYALSDEMHQLFVPGRVASVSDLTIDGLGFILGSIIYRW